MGFLGIIRADKAWERKILSKRLDKLPFAVARSSRATLVEQVAEGLRRAIDSGFYKPGDVLPTTRGLAAALGVSRIVTRAAVRELAEAGLINPKPSVGSVVLGRHGKLWRGNVLFVQRNDGRVWYVNVFTAALRARLVKAGWLFTESATVPEPDGTTDTSELELHITHPAALAVTMFDNPPAEKLLSRSGLPFVTLGKADRCKLKGCVGHIDFDRTAAAPMLAAVAKRAGVRTALEFGVRPKRKSDVSAAFAAAGIRLSHKIMRQPALSMAPASFWKAARDEFSSWTKSALPDLVYFTDDNICAGAVAAFAASGVRVPEDVRVATWANCGNEPPFGKDIDRMALDPAADAELVAEALLARLEGDTRPIDFDVKPRFFKGYTI